MADLVVVVPSHGRPESARALVEVFRNTCTADTFLMFAVDEDDPRRMEYDSVGDGRRSAVLFAATHTMVEALNYVASAYAADPTVGALGFMGDDHCPRTWGWDQAYLDALRDLGSGIVYGDDLLQGENLPTQCAMTADIVRTLGYMAPPSLRHLYVDNFWRDLGQAAGCIRYLPDVIVEHRHPVAGKVAMDDGYARVNAPETYSADGRAYAAYQAGEMPAAVAKVRMLRADAARAAEHEWRLFDEGTVPDYTTPEWYAGREHAPHLEDRGHRGRLLATATLAAQAAFTGKLTTVVDLGSGDGGLLSLLGPNLRAWGYDLMPENVEAAKKRGVDVRYGDVVNGDIEWGEVAVCTEMLEHLLDPHAFVRRIAQHAQALVCSSPRDERRGHAYEYHTWAWDLEGYRALVEQGGFKVIRQKCVDRFQVILAVRQ